MRWVFTFLWLLVVDFLPAQEIGKKPILKEVIFAKCYSKLDKRHPKNISQYTFKIIDSLYMMGQKVYQIDMFSRSDSILTTSFLYDADADYVVRHLSGCLGPSQIEEKQKKQSEKK
jgi:hypothetical protein